MQLSKPRILISSKSKIKLLKKLAAETNYVRKVIALDKTDENNSNELEYAALMKDKQVILVLEFIVLVKLPRSLGETKEGNFA